MELILICLNVISIGKYQQFTMHTRFTAVLFLFQRVEVSLSSVYPISSLLMQKKSQKQTEKSKQKYPWKRKFFPYQSFSRPFQCCFQDAATPCHACLLYFFPSDLSPLLYSSRPNQTFLLDSLCSPHSSCVSRSVGTHSTF